MSKVSRVLVGVLPLLLLFVLLSVSLPSQSSEAETSSMNESCGRSPNGIFVDSLQGQVLPVCPGHRVSISQRQDLTAYRNRRITVGVQLAEAVPAKSQIWLLLSTYAGSTQRQFTTSIVLSPRKDATISMSIHLPPDVDYAVIEVQSSGATGGSTHIAGTIFDVDPRDLREGEMSVAARAYLGKVTEILRRSLYYDYDYHYDHDSGKDKMALMERQLLIDATGARSTEDTYAAIMIAIRALGDKHASAIDLRNWRSLFASERPGKPQPLVIPDAVVSDGVAYLKPPAFATTKMSIGNEFAERMVAVISKAEPAATGGWIIDLRGNPGGSLWPVLLAMSPFFDDGVLGYFQDRDGDLMPWRLSNGAIFAGPGENNRLMARRNKAAIRSRVAVLVDPTTMSAAEALAIAFKGRPDTVLIGTPTAGLTTGVVTHDLSDGMRLNISESNYVDSARVVYKQQVPPDLTICDERSTDPSAVDPWMSAARQWLASSAVRNGCK